MILEESVITNLLLNDEYSKKVFPFIKPVYFDSDTNRKIFETFAEHVANFKASPSIEALKILLEKRNDIRGEKAFQDIISKLDSLKRDAKTDMDFLVSQTEEFVRHRDIVNSVKQAVNIISGEDKNLDLGSLPKLFEDSLSIAFDADVGHDFLEDFEDRHAYYHQKLNRIPFDIDILNTVTKGGLPAKTLTILMGSTGGGKSLVMGHMAASHLMFGKNVLYITMELAEEEVAKRIDANILDITMDDLMLLPKDVYSKRINHYKSRTPGKLIIKEYPTGSAHVNHFRFLLNELKFKKRFVPDIIFIDYINICSSARIKANAATNSYSMVKSIAEEIRGLAVSQKVPIVSATQTNRGGYNNSDVDLTNVSESIGLPETADAFFVLSTSPQLEELGQLQIKQLKNRWGDINRPNKFVVGIDRSKMKLYNLDPKAQEILVNEGSGSNGGNTGGSVFDKGNFGSQYGNDLESSFSPSTGKSGRYGSPSFGKPAKAKKNDIQI